MTPRRAPRRSTPALLVLASIAVACTVACAVRRSEPKSAPPTRTAPSAEESGTGGAGAGGEGSDDGTAPTAPAPAAAPAPVMPGPAGGATGTVVTPDALAQAQAAFDDASKAFAASTSDCASLCKALSSMTNATARLCALTESGPPDQQRRCTDARAKLGEAQAKVQSSCGVC